MRPIARRAAVATIVAIAATAALLPGTAAPAGAAPAVPGVPTGYRPLTIKTLPPIPGVRVQFNGTELVTGPDGS